MAKRRKVKVGSTRKPAAKIEKAAKKKPAQKKPPKKAIESYDHKGKKRSNNPPVGLVTPDTDPDHGKKKTYEYDPQLVSAGDLMLLNRIRPVCRSTK